MQASAILCFERGGVIKYGTELPSISTWDCHTYHGSHYWKVCKVCDVRYHWLILRTRLAQLFSRSYSFWCTAVKWLPVPVPTSSWWSWWTLANIYPTSTSSARYDSLWSLYLLSDDAPCELLEYDQHAHHLPISQVEAFVQETKLYHSSIARRAIKGSHLYWQCDPWPTQW